MNVTLMKPREGFALATTILLVLCMTAALTASFSRTGAEVRAVDNQRAETAAYALAEAGLQRYLARGRITPTDTTMVLPGGKARVRLTLFRTAMTSTDTPLYVIRSDGVVAGGAAATPQGRRTVGQFGYWVRAQIKLPGMWNSLSGLHKNGLDGAISGFDLCTLNTIAGVAVPDSGYTYNYDLLGIPPIMGMPALKTMGTADAFANELKIDWAAMMNPELPTLKTDKIVCFPGTPGYDSRWGPCTSWPSASDWANTTYWPAILINGSAPLPSSGRGMLMVTGNLKLNGGQAWDGLLMVGKQLEDQGTGRVTGAVVSGLNLTAGETGILPSQADGTKQYLYDSCAVAKAAQTQSQWLHVPNAWVDNWISW